MLEITRSGIVYIYIRYVYNKILDISIPHRNKIKI